MTRLAEPCKPFCDVWIKYRFGGVREYSVAGNPGGRRVGWQASTTQKGRKKGRDAGRKEDRHKGRKVGKADRPADRKSCPQPMKDGMQTGWHAGM
ncbi:hypothetical protein DPMN_072454 [Dreissena polymorpha]|uniref:Uncharacterized protein n=1 Tax=Dreissena polymorpha TaxID=45954 RepID=A0A9D4BWH3_DREPO|nr:hypothetical protein DPMN_072454 [Dreissena polymorpha]